MKFCKDCKHYIGDEGHCSEAIKRTVETKVSLVTGQLRSTTNVSFASVARKFDFYCGEEAKWFEPLVAEMAEGGGA